MPDEQNAGQEEKGKTAQGVTLSVRDQGADTHYANTCLVTSTPEEVVMSFAVNLQPFQREGTVEMRINNRVIMTYPSAKRLAITISQVIQRYESVHGVIRLERGAAAPVPPPAFQSGEATKE